MPSSNFDDFVYFSSNFLILSRFYFKKYIIFIIIFFVIIPGVIKIVGRFLGPYSEVHFFFSGTSSSRMRRIYVTRPGTGGPSPQKGSARIVRIPSNTVRIVDAPLRQTNSVRFFFLRSHSNFLDRSGLSGDGKIVRVIEMNARFF